MLFALASPFFYRIVGVVDAMTIKTWNIGNLIEQLACGRTISSNIHAGIVGGGKQGCQQKSVSKFTFISILK